MLRRTIDSNPENVDKLAMVYVSASGLVSRDPARLDHALELGTCVGIQSAISIIIFSAITITVYGDGPSM